LAPNAAAEGDKTTRPLLPDEDEDDDDDDEEKMEAEVVEEEKDMNNSLFAFVKIGLLVVLALCALPLDCESTPRMF
jgi:hypothetical protein